MNRLLVPLGVLAAGLAVYFVVRQDDPPPTDPTIEADAAAIAPRKALPSIAIKEPIRDAMVPDGALTLEVVRRKGLSGRAEEWAATMMDDYKWTPVPGEPNTFTGGNAIKLEFVVEDGRIIGANAFFSAEGMSADAKALSPFLVGEHAAMPMHFETDDVKEAPDVGEFELEDGRKFYYRGTYRTDGEPPYGPKTLEVSTKPFPG